jgi:flagellar hook assembly protein FlgD
VTIRNAAGSEVARGSGTGTAVDWTWDASAVFFGDYTYAISAGPDVRPATGRVPGPPPLVVRNLAATPTVLTPNGDGVAEEMKISFTLTTSATVTVTIRDEAGNVVATPVRDRTVGAGPFRAKWDGTGASGVGLLDGRYTLRVHARSPVQEASAARAIVVDRTLGFLTVSPPAFSPNGDGRLDRVAVAFRLERPADVTARIRAGGKPVADLAAAGFGAGDSVLEWNGLTSAGRAFPDGAYRVVVTASTPLGTRTLKQWLVLDTTRPAVRILSARFRDGVTSVRFSVSEWALVRIWFDDVLVRLERNAGTFTVARRLRSNQVRVVARDRAANIRRTSARVAF